MAQLIIFFYRILGNILIWPAVLLLSRHPNFRSTIPRRLGITLPAIPNNRKTVWIHAASVGEVKAISGLIKALRSDSSDLFICVSCMTATGREVAGKISEIDLVIPFPFDLAWVMRRYLLCLHPELLMIVETELWPNMILMAARLGVPVAFVNARMTDRSYSRFDKVGFVIKEVLKDVRVFAMADSDAARFFSLGAHGVEVLGNLKLDHIGDVNLKKRDALRKELGVENRPVFIAGSIREGEEKDVIASIAYAASHIKGLYSIVAPRHPEMLGTLKKLAEYKGLIWGLRSVMPPDIDLLFIDTFGELFDLYGASDAAFVGGSLKDLGGQNILEPIAWGVPTIHGTYMSNFTWALDVVKGYTVVVKNTRELGSAIVDMFKNRKDSMELGRNALDTLRKKQGITQRYRREISLYLGRRQ